MIVEITKCISYTYAIFYRKKTAYTYEAKVILKGTKAILYSISVRAVCFSYGVF
jgi:hypothetical protein